MIQTAKHSVASTVGVPQEEEHDTMTINEEVKVTEWAPAVFHAIRKMDGITS